MCVCVCDHLDMRCAPQPPRLYVMRRIRRPPWLRSPYCPPVHPPDLALPFAAWLMINSKFAVTSNLALFVPRDL